MKNNELGKYFKEADILFYHNDPDNAPHHTTWFGKLIGLSQSIFWGWSTKIDTSVTHVSLVGKPYLRRPQEGKTALSLYDILKEGVVSKRDLEHNYSFSIFRLRRNEFIHSAFSAEELAQKAYKVISQFEGVRYNRRAAFEVFWDWENREGIPQGRAYTAWLVKRFSIDPRSGSFKIDKERDSVICVELAILSYQIAWLLLAGEEAFCEPLPHWLNIHAHATPAGFKHFLSQNAYFEKIPQELTDFLRYSGAPDHRDWQSPSYVQHRMNFIFVPPVHPDQEKLTPETPRSYTAPQIS